MFGKIAKKRIRRYGAALVEAALTLPIVLMLVFGMIDLALGVLQYNVLAEAVRYGAREAIVHGADASPERATWDSAAAEAAIFDQVAPLLAASAVDLDNVTVAVSYEKDASNNDITTPGSPVEVTITAVYSPLTPYIAQDIDLVARSRMIIAN